MRSAPIAEQQAMQAYVRQRLNLDPGQAPFTPEDQDQLLQRPPLASDVNPASVPEQLQLPVDMTGGYSKGKNFGQTTEPFAPKVMLRKTVPFAQP